jgi:hypothetical protein
MKKARNICLKSKYIQWLIDLHVKCLRFKFLITDEMISARDSPFFLAFKGSYEKVNPATREEYFGRKRHRAWIETRAPERRLRMESDPS